MAATGSSDFRRLLTAVNERSSRILVAGLIRVRWGVIEADAKTSPPCASAVTMPTNQLTPMASAAMRNTVMLVKLGGVPSRRRLLLEALERRPLHRSRH